MSLLISPKAEGDSSWFKDFSSNLTHPAYVQAPVSSATMKNAPCTLNKSTLDAILKDFFSELRARQRGQPALRQLLHQAH